MSFECQSNVNSNYFSNVCVPFTGPSHKAPVQICGSRSRLQTENMNFGNSFPGVAATANSFPAGAVANSPLHMLSVNMNNNSGQVLDNSADQQRKVIEDTASDIEFHHYLFKNGITCGQWPHVFLNPLQNPSVVTFLKDYFIKNERVKSNISAHSPQQPAIPLSQELKKKRYSTPDYFDKKSETGT